MKDKKLPLDGVTILDLTHALAGPLSTQRLAEMGAEAIKVETTFGGGDFSRGVLIGELKDFNDSVAFVAMNRNKKSISINLKTLEGQELFYELVTQSDVLVQNYRPGVVERLKISYTDLHKVNPKLVYVSISGYGSCGPMAGRPGQDLLLQSFCGLTMNGGMKENNPAPSPLFIVDVGASHLATEAVLAGLYHVEKTGEGLESNVSMVSAVMEMQLQEITTYLAHKTPPKRIEFDSATIWMDPPYGIHKTKDGYLALAQCDLSILADLLTSTDLHVLAEDKPSFEHTELSMQWRDEVYALLEKIFMQKSAKEWDAYLNEYGVWCMKVQDYEEFLSHEQTQHYLVSMEHYKYGTYKTVKPAIEFNGIPAVTLSSAPEYASHTKEILLAKGISETRINDLIQKKIIYQKSEDK